MDGLGLNELYWFENHAGYDGVMLGLDAVAALIYFRALFRHLPLPDELAEQSVGAILAAIRRNP